MKCENVLDAVGRTPIVRLNRLTRGLKAAVYAKLEFMNPGGSVKDRIAISMIEGAEKRGVLKPGGTIVEGTSGNTGFGLALAAVVKGYKLIVTIQDKQSREKINMLKALGAEVIVCPTAVAPEDPRSYYSVARKLSKEIPDAYYINQYDNPDNLRAHYETTGPEIWKDSEGRVTHLVGGMGTGGTISGAAKFLKEKNPKIKVVGVDPIGSIIRDYFYTGKIMEAHEYKVEGIGEDIIPGILDFNLLDEILPITDKESMVTARRLAREEGIFAGGSAGTAVAGALKVASKLTADDLVVVIIPDSGSRALSKLYNDEWMEENRFLDAGLSVRAEEIVRWKGGVKNFVVAAPGESVGESLKKMQELEISQIPVMEEGNPVGAIFEDDILRMVMHGKSLEKTIVREVMTPSFPVVGGDSPLDRITALIPAKTPAVLVDLGGGKFDIITKYDLVHSISKIAERMA